MDAIDKLKVAAPPFRIRVFVPTILRQKLENNGNFDAIVAANSTSLEGWLQWHNAQTRHAG